MNAWKEDQRMRRGIQTLNVQDIMEAGFEGQAEPSALGESDELQGLPGVQWQDTQNNERRAPIHTCERFGDLPRSEQRVVKSTPRLPPTKRSSHREHCERERAFEVRTRRSLANSLFPIHHSALSLPRERGTYHPSLSGPGSRAPASVLALLHDG